MPEASKDYTIYLTYPAEAQDYLDHFASGATNIDDETEADGSTDTDPKYAELERRNQQLESELEELQQKYDLLVQIIGDSGIDIEGE